MTTFRERYRKVFGWSGHQGVIADIIRAYTKLRKSAPEMSENERLNMVLISRIKSRQKGDARENEERYYLDSLLNPRKTFEELLTTMVIYECIQSNVKEFYSTGAKVGLSYSEIFKRIGSWRRQIEKVVRESIRSKVEGKKEP